MVFFADGFAMDYKYNLTDGTVDHCQCGFKIEKKCFVWICFC